MSKTIYLISENRLPFSPKGSTFSIKKVYLFRWKGLPFLKKVRKPCCKDDKYCIETTWFIF